MKKCAICEEAIKDGEYFLTYDDEFTHACCLLYNVAFEVDNTMMVFGIAKDAGFEKARKHFQLAFLQTMNSHCQHRKEWKGWPWGAKREKPMDESKVMNA